MILAIILIGLTLTSVLSPSTGEDCFYKSWPWCHYVWYGFGVSYDLDRLCCPSVNHHITLCNQKDFQGNCTTQLVPRNKCVRVIDKWTNSVNTTGKCYRLYENGDCSGKSVAVQPGMSHHDNLMNLDMDTVLSVSRCFTSDICQPDSTSSPDYRLLGCQWGNSLLYIGYLSWLPFDTEIKDNSPVLWYQTGHWIKRTEVMRAQIFEHNLGNGSATDDNAEKHAIDMGYPSDTAGHILPRYLGGSGTDLRNIFPRGRNFSRMEYAHVAADVEKFVQKYGSAYFTVNLEYHLVSESRPYLLIYQITPGNGSLDDIRTDTIANPDP